MAGELFRYNCRDYPGMGDCVGSFTASTRDEVMKLAELHARESHQEDPAGWSAEDRRQVDKLIRSVDA